MEMPKVGLRQSYADIYHWKLNILGPIFISQGSWNLHSLHNSINTTARKFLVVNQLTFNQNGT